MCKARRAGLENPLTYSQGGVSNPSSPSDMSSTTCQERFCIHTKNQMPLDAIPSSSHIQAQSTWAKPKALPRERLTAKQHRIQLRPSPLTGPIQSL